MSRIGHLIETLSWPELLALGIALWVTIIAVGVIHRHVMGRDYRS